MSSALSRTTSSDLPNGDRKSQSFAGLLRRLTQELTTLFRRELALASAELGQSIRTTLNATAGIALGGAVLFAGLLTLLAAAVLGLGRLMPGWLAALIVGLSVCLVGGVSLLYCVRRLQNKRLLPRRSVRSLEKDKDVIARKASS